MPLTVKPRKLLNSLRPPSPETSAMHELTNREGAGVLLLSRNTGRALLGKRGEDCESPRTWAPFGGMVEPGEQPHVAAVRELYEEAGVRATLVSASPVYANRDARTGFTFYTFFALCSGEPQVVLNEESSGYGWFHLLTDDMPAPMHPGFALLMSSSAVRALIKRALNK